VSEHGGFAAGEVFRFAYTLILGVMRDEFECHVAGRKLEAVNAGSAPISDELDATACFPEAAPHVFGEVDDVWSGRIHRPSVGGHERPVAGGIWARAHAFTRR
jgi:hypothetical protein